MPERLPTILGKPPLVEVFCEFFFQTEEKQEWDPFYVRDFFDRIKKKFPKRRHLTSVGFQLKLGGDAPDTIAASPPGQAPIPRHRFVTDDEKTLVQLGHHLLVVNQLPPYYGWHRFAPTVMECFEHYLSTWKAPSVSRVALHYIDNVVIPESQFELGKYFRLFPVLPKPDATIANLAMAFEVQGAEEGDILAVAFRQVPSSSPDATTFMLQWDYVGTKPRKAEPSTIEKWLSQTHRFMDDYFHESFTQECWAIFEPKGGV